MNVKRALKTVSLFVCSVFTWNTLCLSAPESVYTIDIPAEYGTVRQRYKGTDHKTIIHIQDAHASSIAQENIAHIINLLSNKQDNQQQLFVGVEGAAGAVPVEDIRMFPVQKARDAAAFDFIHQGLLSGVECAAITDLRGIALYGIEDEGLFTENLQQYKSVSEYQETFTAVVCAVENIMETLKPKIYSDALRIFDECATRYECNRLSEYEYLPTLYAYAVQQKYNLEKYPTIYSLSEKTGNSESVDTYTLCQEIQLLINEVRSQLAISDKERQLVGIQQYMRIIKKIGTMQASKNNFEEYLKYYKTFDVENMVQRITAFAHQYDSDCSSMPSAIELTTMIKHGESFYEDALRRDTVLTQNMLTAMHNNNDETAVMVTGGFHSDGITAQLRQQGINYVTITPALSANDMYGSLQTRIRNVQSLGENAALQSTITALSLYCVEDRPSFLHAFDVQAIGKAIQLIIENKADENTIRDQLSLLGPLRPLAQENFHTVVKNIQFIFDSFMSEIKKNPVADELSPQQLFDLLAQENKYFRFYDQLRAAFQGFYKVPRVVQKTSGDVKNAVLLNVTDTVEQLHAHKKIIEKHTDLGMYDDKVVAGVTSLNMRKRTNNNEGNNLEPMWAIRGMRWIYRVIVLIIKRHILIHRLVEAIERKPIVAHDGQSYMLVVKGWWRFVNPYARIAVYIQRQSDGQVSEHPVLTFWYKKRIVHFDTMSLQVAFPEVSQRTNDLTQQGLGYQIIRYVVNAIDPLTECQAHGIIEAQTRRYLLQELYLDEDTIRCRSNGKKVVDSVPRNADEVSWHTVLAKTVWGRLLLKAGFNKLELIVSYDRKGNGISDGELLNWWLRQSIVNQSMLPFDIKGTQLRRFKNTGHRQMRNDIQRHTSGFVFSNASLYYPRIRQMVIDEQDDYAVYQTAIDQGWIDVFRGGPLSYVEFYEFRAHVQERIDAVQIMYPSMSAMKVLLVQGLDRVAEYISSENVMLIDVRSPLWLIELAVVDEFTHATHQRLSAAEQEILSFQNQAKYLNENPAWRTVTDAELSELATTGKDDFNFDIGECIAFLWRIRALHPEEQRIKSIRWMSEHAALYDETVASEIKVLSVYGTRPLKTHSGEMYFLKTHRIRYEDDVVTKLSLVRQSDWAVSEDPIISFTVTGEGKGTLNDFVVFIDDVFFVGDEAVTDLRSSGIIKDIMNMINVNVADDVIFSTSITNDETLKTLNYHYIINENGDVVSRANGNKVVDAVAGEDEISLSDVLLQTKMGYVFSLCGMREYSMEYRNMRDVSEGTSAFKQFLIDAQHCFSEDLPSFTLTGKKRSIARPLSIDEAYDMFIQDDAPFAGNTLNDLNYSRSVAAEFAQLPITDVMVVGMGLSYLPFFLVLQGKNVIFVDFDPKAYTDMQLKYTVLQEKVKQQGRSLSGTMRCINQEIQRMELEKYAIQPYSFDAITFIDLIGGVPRGYPEDWLHKAQELLRRDAYMMIDERTEHYIIWQDMKEPFEKLFPQHTVMAEGRYINGAYVSGRIANRLYHVINHTADDHRVELADGKDMTRLQQQALSNLTAGHYKEHIIKALQDERPILIYTTPQISEALEFYDLKSQLDIFPKMSEAITVVYGAEGSHTEYINALHDAGANESTVIVLAQRGEKCDATEISRGVVFEFDLIQKNKNLHDMFYVHEKHIAAFMVIMLDLLERIQGNHESGFFAIEQAAEQLEYHDHPRYKLNEFAVSTEVVSRELLNGIRDRNNKLLIQTAA